MQRAASQSPEYYSRFLSGIAKQSLRLTDFRIKIIHYDNKKDDAADRFEKIIMKIGEQNHQKMKIVFN